MTELEHQDALINDLENLVTSFLRKYDDIRNSGEIPDRFWVRTSIRTIRNAANDIVEQL